MLDQDRTPLSLDMLRSFVEDIETEIRNPETVCIEVVFCVQNTKGQIRRGSMACGQVSVMQHRKITLAILERLVGMEKEIDDAPDSQQVEVAHVQ